MVKSFTRSLAAFAAAAALIGGFWGASGEAKAGETSGPSAHAYSFEMTGGETIDLAAYAGKPVLVVNMDARCQYASQHGALQALWLTYRERGVVIIGVPSKDFGGGVARCEGGPDHFPMTAATPVLGDAAAPFWRWISDKVGAPRWSYHKYLIGPDGRLEGYFGPEVKPDNWRITDRIDYLLFDSEAKGEGADRAAAGGVRPAAATAASVTLR